MKIEFVSWKSALPPSSCRFKSHLRIMPHSRRCQRWLFWNDSRHRLVSAGCISGVYLAPVVAPVFPVRQGSSPRLLQVGFTGLLLGFGFASVSTRHQQPLCSQPSLATLALQHHFLKHNLPRINDYWHRRNLGSYLSLHGRYP
jgi:hypothetical protein